MRIGWKYEHEMMSKYLLPCVQSFCRPALMPMKHGNGTVRHVTALMYDLYWYVKKSKDLVSVWVFWAP